MKKKLIRITGILATIALLALIIFSKKGLLSSENDRSGFVSSRNATVLPVKAMRVVPAPLNDVLVAAGTVLADEEVEIAAEASGRITKIYFTGIFSQRCFADDMGPELGKFSFVKVGESAVHICTDDNAEHGVA